MPFDQAKLENYPQQSGVYLMKGTDNTVLYVGKAKNLRQRIRNYFAISGDSREMIPRLLKRVENIDTIVVGSEKEALLLENILIKKHQPHFNALLKDDKGHIALKITYSKQWPQLEFSRYKGKPPTEDLYFGPYPSAMAARETFDLLNQLFPLRQCSDMEFARRTRPCILYEMKRCIAPCVDKCTQDEYDKNVEKTIRFLKGEDKQVLKELYNEMEQASERLEFEKAGEILKRVRRIENTVEKQKVHNPQGGDKDALAIFRQGEDLICQQLIFREGKLIASNHFNFVDIAQDDRELLSSFILQHYEKQELLPGEILLPIPLDDANILADILSKDKKGKIAIHAPQRGEKKALVEMAYANAESTFKKEKDLHLLREKMLLEMQEKLQLKNYPRRIECFDNSNLSGTEPVSSLVAFTAGEKDSKRYRKYKIKQSEGSDDYASMREVLSRRYKRAKEENDLPDLIIVDGGKGHLNIALGILRELDIVTVDVIGIAKEKGRHDKGSSQEQVYLSEVKDPVLLKATSPILFLLQRIRDEAHRTALLFQKNRRGKKIIQSKLDTVPGIGAKKKKQLLLHFGSVKKIEEASEEELKNLKFLNKTNIKVLREYLSPPTS